MAVHQDRILRIVYAGLNYRAAFDKIQSLLPKIKDLVETVDPLTYSRLTDANYLLPTKLQDDLILIEETKHFYKVWKGNETRARYNRVRRGQDPLTIRRPQIAHGLTPEQMIEALIRNNAPPTTRRDLDQPISPQPPPHQSVSPLSDAEKAAVLRDADALFAEEERDKGYFNPKAKESSE